MPPRALLCLLPLATAAWGQTTWKPNPAQLAKLAGPTQVDEYELRAPKGFQMKAIKAPTGTAFGWVGNPRKDDTRPMLILAIVAPPKGTAKKTLDQVAATFLNGVKARRTNWKQSKATKGKIGGYLFIRHTWTGKDKTTGLPMHGFQYLTQDGPQFVQIWSQDLAANPLTLTEAAARTFRKP